MQTKNKKAILLLQELKDNKKHVQKFI